MQEGSVTATQPTNKAGSTTLTLPKHLVVIGASVGGPLALAQLVPAFPEFFAGVLIIVQQMRPGFTKLLPQMLNASSELVVREGENHCPIFPGLALVAPGGSICSVARHDDWSTHPLTLRVSDAEEPKTHGPIDSAMISAVQAYGDKVIGVMLTGIGNDGREGMRAIREHKGCTIAQDEATCTLSDAPRMIADLGLADDILPLWAIPDRIMEIVGE